MRHRDDACYDPFMREGRWFGYSVRAIHRAIAGAASEATLRRWATDAEDITTAVLVDIDERDALTFAHVFAASAGTEMHRGTVRHLTEQLLRLTPLPVEHGWITLTGTTVHYHATSDALINYLTRVRVATTVIPIR